MSAPALATTDRLPSHQPKRHLFEIEIVRVITFACVVAVHSISWTAQNHNSTQLLASELHFTRGVFFALTGFLLTYGAYQRPKPLHVFWPRRFYLVGMPYITWSLAYMVFWQVENGWDTPLNSVLVSTARAILRGTASPQLYFLLVTMQVYLIIPALVWLLKRYKHAHLYFLEVAFIVQFLIFTAVHYFPNRLTPITNHLPIALQTLFPTYLFFIVGGAVAGAHGEQFLRWVRVRRPAISLMVTGGFLLTACVFLVQAHLGQTVVHAAAEMQPVVLVWSICVGLGLVTLGAWWADSRHAGSPSDRFLKWASDRSFGIFLSHVVFISLFVNFGPTSLPWWAQTTLCYFSALVLAAALTECLRRSPASLPFTGRPMIRTQGQSGSALHRRNEQPVGHAG